MGLLSDAGRRRIRVGGCKGLGGCRCSGAGSIVDGECLDSGAVHVSVSQIYVWILGFTYSCI